MTASPATPAIPSISLRMIQQWWGSSQVGMRLHIGRRSKDCLHGVQRTTSSSTPQRPKSWGLMYKDLRGFLSKTLRTPKFGKLLRTNKSGCINPCVSTISRRFSLYIPINVKLCARARARLSAQSPPSFNMLISINRPAVVRLLGERR